MQQQQAASSTYQAGSIILPEEFNLNSRGIITPQRNIITSDILDDGYIRSAQGILRPDGRPYVPQRTYFFFNRASNVHVLPGSKIFTPSAAPAGIDHSESIKAVSEDQSLGTTNPCADLDFMQRLKEGVFDDFNRRRALLGFASLEQAVANLKNRTLKEDLFVDDISAITRSVSGHHYRH